MRTITPAAWRSVVFLLCSALLIAACAGPATTDSSGNNDESELQITLIPAPEADEGDTMTIALADGDGQPITDATVALEGNMNHAGMVPVIVDGVNDADDGREDGRYELPFAFTMLGDWILSVNVTLADGSTLSRNLDVAVSEGSVTGQSVATPADTMSSDSMEMDADAAEHDEMDHGTMDEFAVHVHNARSRPSPLEGGTTAVYLSLHNDADQPVTLTGATSPAAERAEIHQTIDDNGVMRMQKLEEGLVLEPQSEVDLMPGGIHIMLVGLVAPLDVNDMIEVTLQFDGPDNMRQEMVFEVPVVTLDASMEGMEMEEEHDHGD